MAVQRRYHQIVGDEINSEIALVQAAQTFDLAATFATESKDVENLIRIGMAWSDFSNLLGGVSKTEDEETEEEEPRILGFTGKRIEDGGTKSSGPISAGSHSRNGERGVYKKHGEL